MTTHTAKTPEGWEGEAKKQKQGGTEKLEWRKLGHRHTGVGLSYCCLSAVSGPSGKSLHCS